MKRLHCINLSAFLFSFIGSFTDFSETTDTDIDYSGIAEMYQEAFEEIALSSIEPWKPINKTSSWIKKLTKQELDKVNNNKLKPIYNDLSIKVTSLKKANSSIAVYTKILLKKWLLEEDRKKQEIYEKYINQYYSNFNSIFIYE